MAKSRMQSSRRLLEASSGEAASPELVEAAVGAVLEEASQAKDLSDEVKDYLAEQTAAILYERWSATEEHRVRVLRALRRRRRLARASRQRNRR